MNVVDALADKCAAHVKTAAARWVQLLRSGALSAPSVQRITQSMAPGSFRFVRSMGRGSNQLADLMAGNLGGGQAGLMVRKLPLRELPAGYTLPSYYQGLVDESRRINQAIPGAVAPYLQATPQGIFQTLAQGRELHQPWYSRLWDRLRGMSPLTQEELRLRHGERLANRLRGYGITDVQHNVTPGGPAFDFASLQHQSPSVNAFSFMKQPYLPPVRPHVDPQYQVPLEIPRRALDVVRRHWLMPWAVRP